MGRRTHAISPWIEAATNTATKMHFDFQLPSTEHVARVEVPVMGARFRGGDLVEGLAVEEIIFWCYGLNLKMAIALCEQKETRK